MKSSAALTKLKAILIIDILIVATAAGVYFYLQAEGLLVGAPKEAEFILTNLTINPLDAEVYEPVLVTVNVTNIGDTKGDYVANLTINSVVEQSQTVLVLGKNFTIVEFTVIKETEGSLAVEIGDLSSSITINPPSPTSSKITLSDFSVTPYEAWVNETITAKITATNQGSEPEILAVRLMHDNSFLERRVFELAGQESVTAEFMFNATTEGTHTVNLNALSKKYTVVPTGYHTLIIRYSGGGSDLLPFILNGESLNMPYTELMPVGEYTISTPTPFTTDTAVFEFNQWSNGDKRTTTKFTLENRMGFIATYDLISGYSSCPSLFYWNGTDYVYVTEVSNAGWLGYIDYIDENGEIVFGGGNPWDTIKLDSKQLTAKSSDSGEYFDVLLFQKWDEIFYLDAAYMMVVDHPSDVDVYSTMVNYVNPTFPDKIYTVNKNNLKIPISAVNEKGDDVLPQITYLDGTFTPGSNGLTSPSWDDILLNQLTLNLGDLSDAKEIRLIINGMIDWGSPDHYYDWIEGFKTAFNKGFVKNRTQIYPPPYMEIMDTNGNWVLIPPDRQMPTPSDYVPRSFAVDLTGLFPKDLSEYQIRINNFFNVTFDYIGIDTSQQADIKVRRIDADANFHQEFSSPSSALGEFTRYGDVTQLILEGDDMFVIGMQGDQVSLHFPTENLPPLEDGLERDFFMFVACWFKDPPGNWGYGFDFAVDPLPFLGMSGFPYPDSESYPYDDEHLQFLQEYNTRVITTPSQPILIESSVSIWAMVVMMILAVVDGSILIYFKKRKK